MKCDDAISRLRAHEADLKRLGVEHLYLFGSTARGEARDDSDVDLFFDYVRGKFGLFELMDVQAYAARRPRPQDGHRDARQPAQVVCGRRSKRRR